MIPIVIFSEKRSLPRYRIGLLEDHRERRSGRAPMDANSVTRAKVRILATLAILPARMSRQDRATGRKKNEDRTLTGH